MKYNVEENKVTGIKTIYVHLEDGDSPQKQVAEVLTDMRNIGPAFVVIYRENSDVVTKYHAYNEMFKLENEAGTKGYWRDAEGNHVLPADVNQEEIVL